jgi:hypothetical protein
MSGRTCLSSPSRCECSANYQALRTPTKGQAPGAPRALLLRLPSPHHTAFPSLHSIPRLAVRALPPGRTTGAGRRASPLHVTVLLWRSAHQGSCRLLDVRFTELKEPSRSSSSCSLWSTSTARRPWSQAGATPCFASSNRSQPARLLSSPCQLEERRNVDFLPQGVATHLSGWCSWCHVLRRDASDRHSGCLVPRPHFATPQRGSPQAAAAVLPATENTVPWRGRLRRGGLCPQPSSPTISCMVIIMWRGGLCPQPSNPTISCMVIIIPLQDAPSGHPVHTPNHGRSDHSSHGRVHIQLLLGSIRPSHPPICPWSLA